VEAWIDFGRGALFRLAFALMVLGLLRIFLLSVLGITEAYRRSPDKIVPWKDIAQRTAAWLVPVALWRRRTAYSVTSFLFHIGLISVPLLLAAHALLWRRSTGLPWPAMSQSWANWLTVLTIVTGLGLFGGRLFHRGARTLSRPQDYTWPLLLIVPFATGYLCSNLAISPRTYQEAMLLHVYSADLIMMMIPFTKVAHCVLAPLSQVVTAVSWKFVAGAGDRVAATLGHADQPSWGEKARLAAEDAAPAAQRKEVCVR
jgi:nitrate reductase gamma subunit